MSSETCLHEEIQDGRRLRLVIQTVICYKTDPNTMTGNNRRMFASHHCITYIHPLMLLFPLSKEIYLDKTTGILTIVEKGTYLLELWGNGVFLYVAFFV